MSAERHLYSHIFNIVVFAVGGAAFVLLMRNLGLDNARRVFADAGAWLAVVVGLDLATMACDAAAIHAFMRPEARMVSYLRVLAAQASGRAINIFVPGGVVGETTKVTMLVSHAPRDRVVSSIVLYNLATLYISVAIVIIGVPITTALVDLPHELAIAAWVGLGVVVAFVVALAIIIHRGALGTLLASVTSLRLVSPARAERWRARFIELDRHIKELQSDQSPGTRLGLGLLACSRVISWAATTTVLYAVGVHLTLTLLVGVLSVGVLIGWISAFVPFGLGLADGSNYALFDVLGASGAHGVFVTLLGRARTLTIALVGLVVMAIGHTINRISVAHRNRRLAQARLAKPSPGALT